MTDKNYPEILVSIVVVAYNCEKVIIENIESCLKEHYSELIIIDNSSTDATPQIISRYLNINKVKFIRNHENKGFTYACNQGIKQARGKYIFLLNPDASLLKDTLTKLVKFLEENHDAGAVAPALFFPNGEFQNYTRTFPSVSGLWVENFIHKNWWHLFPSYNKYTCSKIDFSTTVEVDQPAGAALMFRNRWLLDETYFIYVSDVDLCKNIKEEGFRIYQIPDSRVCHHQSQGGTENSSIRYMLDADNYFGMSYYFKKHKQYIRWFTYRILFSISLFLRFFLSIASSNAERKIRFMKLRAFCLNQNFKELYDKRKL